jgi:hypothetical protein
LNYNQQLNEYSRFDWAWLMHHLENSPVRQTFTKEAMQIRDKAQLLNYQQMGWKSYQVQDLIKQIKILQERWNEKEAEEQLSQWVNALLTGEPIDLLAALAFIERDAAECQRRNRFCYPKAEPFRFLLKQLKDRAFLSRDYESMNRLILLDDFYRPYFLINEEVHAFARKINYSIRMLDWQKLDDIRGLTLNYLQKHREQLCMSTKLVLYRFLIGQYFYAKTPERIGDILDAIFEEYALLPYYNQHDLEVLSLVTFFNNLTHIGEYELAIRYYRKPKLNLKDPKVKGNFYAFLGIALETYDLETAKLYVEELSTVSIDQLRPTLLYLMARYYLLKGKMKQLKPYIMAAISWVKNSKSYEFYFETYSVYFRYLYSQEDYASILKIKQSNHFKKHYKTISKLNIHIFEIELYLLLSKYKRASIREETFNKKLYQLLEPSLKHLNGFLKLRLIENLQTLLKDASLRIASKNKNIVDAGIQEMQVYHDLTDLELRL